MLGFPLENLSQGAHKDGRQKADELALHPPPIDPDTSEGAASRKRLLRAWVELSAWLRTPGAEVVVDEDTPEPQPEPAPEPGPEPGVEPEDTAPPQDTDLFTPDEETAR